MRLLAALRADLLSSPLHIAPEKLLTFAEQGGVTSYRGNEGDNRSIIIKYTAHVIVTDYAGAVCDLLFLVSEWVHANYPSAPEDAVQFALDIIDQKSADVSLKIELSEIISVEQRKRGFSVKSIPEPDVLGMI